MGRCEHKVLLLFFAGISAAAECPGTADSVTGADVDLVDEGISSPRSDTATAPSSNELKTNNTDPSAATLMDCTQTDDKTSDPQGSELTHDKRGSADSVQSAASAPVTSVRAAGVSNTSSQSVVVDGGTLATSDDGLEDLLQGITVDEMSELITLALDDDQTLTQSNTQNSNSEKVDDQLSEVNSHIYVQSLR